MSKESQTVIGVPYYVGQNPYQDGAMPSNVIYGDPMGAPIQQTIYRDTPAPFSCPYCGNSGLTAVRSKPSLSALVGCMMPMMLGICFLCPSMDCLWHKYHYCPHCSNKVADFEKSDPCLVMDPPRWKQPSFALPAWKRIKSPACERKASLISQGDCLWEPEKAPFDRGKDSHNRGHRQVIPGYETKTLIFM